MTTAAFIFRPFCVFVSCAFNVYIHMHILCSRKRVIRLCFIFRCESVCCFRIKNILYENYRSKNRLINVSMRSTDCRSALILIRVYIWLNEWYQIKRNIQKLPERIPQRHIPGTWTLSRNVNEKPHAIHYHKKIVKSQCRSVIIAYRLPSFFFARIYRIYTRTHTHRHLSRSRREYRPLARRSRQKGVYIAGRARARSSLVMD